MSATTRNTFVGLFVLVALVLLGGMIVLFGGHPQAFGNTYDIPMRFPSAGPIIEGSDIRVSGVAVGRVVRIEPVDNFAGGVEIIARITRDIQIPRDCTPVIRPMSLGLSKPWVEIEIGKNPGRGVVPRDGSVVLHGEVKSGFEGLIPPEMQTKLDKLDQSLTKIADSMVELLEPRPTAAVDHPTATSQPAGNISTLVQRMDLTFKRFNDLLDAKNGDVTAVLANLRAISENGRAVSEDMKKFTAKAIVVADSTDKAINNANVQITRIGTALADNSSQLAGALDKLNKSLDAIAQGKGTVGKLVNDPALYESILLSTDRLHQTIVELEQLVKQWEAEGVKIKLK